MIHKIVFIHFFLSELEETPDDTPFKQLHRVVETCLCAPEDSLTNLEMILHKHKPDFIDLLEHSVRSSIQNNYFIR